MARTVSVSEDLTSEDDGAVIRYSHDSRIFETSLTTQVQVVAALPEASAEYRGHLLVLATDGAATDDALYLCKLAADEETYSWVALAEAA